MKCNICGREYVALGVHLRHKHKIAPADYKEEYGMLLATPLVDDWLSERIRSSQQSRLKDPEYKAEVTDRCRANAVKKVGKPGAGMTRAGKESIAKSDKARNQKYLEAQSVVVAEVLREKGTMLDVRKATGTGPTAGRKMAKIAGVDYTRESAKIERDRRAAATTRAKALARVAKVMPYFDTTKSAAEMCRLGGISIKTYKNWLAAGLIARHPNGRGPMPHNMAYLVPYKLRQYLKKMDDAGVPYSFTASTTSDPHAPVDLDLHVDEIEPGLVIHLHTDGTYTTEVPVLIDVAREIP